MADANEERRQAPTTLMVPVNAHVQVDLDHRVAIFPAAHPLMIERFAIAIPVALLKQAIGAVNSAEGARESMEIQQVIAKRNGGIEP